MLAVGYQAAVGKQDQDLEQQAARWAARLAENAAPLSSAERDALDAWCGADPAHARRLEHYCTLWEDPAFIEAAQAIRGRPTRPSRRGLMMGAGSAMLGVAGLAWMGRAPLRRALADASTGPGEIVTLPALPGGGRLMLDTASAVDLPGSGRVSLVAGALRLDLPGGAEAIALGGRWSRWQVAPGSVLALRRHAGEERLAVIEGRASAADGLVASAGTGVTWRDAGPGRPRNLSLAERDAVEGFADGWRLFEAAPLREVAAEVARYMPGVLLVDDVAGSLRVSGRYRLRQPEAVLTLLTQSLPIRLRRFGPLLARLEAA
ncbi:DUF4880 domain-containing protein [Acetobacteraceae bacterium H6797]|nr:DUF4880 domain-containing protein [Acetobacteraceae bacterium H6797]